MAASQEAVIWRDYSAGLRKKQRDGGLREAPPYAPALEAGKGQ